MSTIAEQRRKLRFASLPEVLAEAERLAANGQRTLGTWSYGQILEHLANGMDCAIDGFGPWRAPWYVRWFIAPFVKKQLLHSPMPAGIKLPKQGTELLPKDEVSVEEGLAHLRKAMARLENESPGMPHPFLGKLTPEEYRLLMLRHAELHLSFVLPVV